MCHPGDDPHDCTWTGAPPDPEFGHERFLEAARAMRRSRPAAFAPPPDPGPSAGPRFSVDWVDALRESRYPADPAFPDGTAIDVALDAPRACRVELPCPASRCGTWVVTCRSCGYAIALATAGRRDDPRSVRMPCRG